MYPTCSLESSDDNVIIQIQFGGESGRHGCRITNIELTYEPVEESEPEPLPDSGIIGKIAAVVHRQGVAVNELVEANKELAELMSNWGDAQEWINTYNRNIGVDDE